MSINIFFVHFFPEEQENTFKCVYLLKVVHFGLEKTDLVMCISAKSSFS